MLRIAAHQLVDEPRHARALLEFLRQGDADQPARLGRHRRLAQLLRVHLAEALEA